jgi:protein-disulfide isomerase
MQPRPFISHLAAALGGGLLVLALLAGTGAIGPGGSGPLPSTSPSPSPSPSPAFVDGTALGPPEAPLRIEIWADFQCPFCRLLAHGIEPDLVRAYAVPGRARIVYRDFAFLGPESLAAAAAARCAERQGAFWRYHDLLFASQQGENQGGFRREVLLSLAGFAGLDGAAFRTCLDDPAVAAAVTAETAEGRRLGIDSTPTLRLVGPAGSELLAGLVDFATIAAAVERAARPAPSPTTPTDGAPPPTGTDGANPAPSGSGR